MAGTIVETKTGSGHIKRLTFAAVGDASNGSLPEHVINEKFVGGARLIRFVANPGALTSPSASSSSSVSPSSSASPTLSPSMSASGSLSASASASPSISPSSSTSISPSSSVNPSHSLSPSASASPSEANPTDNFDVSVIDEFGIDILQGVGVDCDANASTSQPILYSSMSVHPTVDESSSLVLKVRDQFVPSGQMTITLVYAMGY